VSKVQRQLRSEARHTICNVCGAVQRGERAVRRELGNCQIPEDPFPVTSTPGVTVYVPNPRKRRQVLSGSNRNPCGVQNQSGTPR